MPTLFGKFVDGQFVPDDNAKIYIYDKSAYEILGKGSPQLEAAQAIQDAINKLSQNRGEVKKKFSLPSQQSQTEDAAESVRDDAELYAQIKQDEDARAALELLSRLHRQTTGGGENALIQKGAYEKRLGDMAAKIKEDTGTAMSDREIRKGLRAIYGAMEQNGYNPGEILTFAREFYQRILEKAPGVLVEQDETTKEIIQALKTNAFKLTEDMKSEIQATYGSLGDWQRKNFGKLKISNNAKVTVHPHVRGADVPADSS